MDRGVELIASFWSLAGNVEPGSVEVSPFDFRAKVEAAAKAGFSGLGLVHDDVMAISQRLGVGQMKQILADNGMRLVEFECLMDWFATGERRKRSDVARRNLLWAAEQFGARHVKVGGDTVNTDRNAWPMEHLAEEFAALCADAAKVGTRIAIEIMPFTNVQTLEQGLELQRLAGAANGGLMLDIWHMERGGIRPADIAKLPKEAVFWVELDDADREVVGGLYPDTIHNRQLCGHGSFDIPAFLK